MNKHHTKLKGDIGLTAIIYDLTKKGGFVFTSVSENCNYDLVVNFNDKLYRIQAKYRGTNKQTISRGTNKQTISSYTNWNDKNGNHKKLYPENAFDFFGVYLADIDKVVYFPYDGFTVSINIRTTLPTSFTPFYWWEDFLNLEHHTPKKRTLHDFGQTIAKRKAWNKDKPNLNIRKVTRPTKEELEKQIWSTPSSQLALRYGVSDTAISKWCKAYKITKPPRGYWAKNHLL